VTGSGVKLAPFVVEHRLFLSAKKLVKDVLVTGIQVRNFSGLNIAVLAARNARVTKNTLTDGAQYGALTLGSVNTLFEGNVVTSTKLGFSIGICMDNQAGVFVSKNHISNQFFALCVQTAGADVQYNEVTASCFGVFVDPGVKGAKIRHNRIGPTNPMCAPFGAVSGITVDGAIKTKVLDNLVEGQKNGGKGAGISLIDDPCVGNESIVCLALGHKAIASGNAIVRNTLRNNDLDIYVNTTGRGNLIACNKCSTPEQFCKF
jgi:nitrous oxidase accessory protein NosD